MKTNHKKKVLMITGVFLPESDIGGLRAAMFSKYLPQYGWEPTVFTKVRSKDDPDYSATQVIDGLPDELNIVKVVLNEKYNQQSQNIFGKIRNFFYPEVAHPPGYLKIMLENIKNIHDLKGKDLIWATCPHLATLKVAAEISRRMKIPWVADFRDIVEQSAFHWPGLRTKIFQKRMCYRRTSIVSSASAVVTVSLAHERILNRYFGHRVTTIRNGFDPFFLSSKKQFGGFRNNKKFTITHMGRLGFEKRGNWSRDPRPLFAAIDALVEGGELDCSDIQVNFYGSADNINDNKELLKMASYYKWNSSIILRPRIPYRDVPTVLYKSSVLLVLTEGTPGVLTTKLFEYLAAKRPILFIPGDNDEIDSILKETNAGYSCPDKNAIKQVIKKLYQQWKATGYTIYEGKEELIEQYSREKQTGVLAELFDTLCE